MLHHYSLNAAHVTLIKKTSNGKVSVSVFGSLNWRVLMKKRTQASSDAGRITLITSLKLEIVHAYFIL